MCSFGNRSTTVYVILRWSTSVCVMLEVVCSFSNRSTSVCVITVCVILRWSTSVCVMLEVMCSFRTRSTSVCGVLHIMEVTCTFRTRSISVCVIKQGSHSLWRSLKFRENGISFSRPWKSVKTEWGLWKFVNFVVFRALGKKYQLIRNCTSQDQTVVFLKI